MAIEELGIAAELAAKREALRASMEKRGASAAALAQFPVMSKPLPPLPKRSVLAVADRTNPFMGEKKPPGYKPPSVEKHDRIKKMPFARKTSHAMPPYMTARVKAIAGVVARAAGLTTEQVLAHRAPRGASAKHMALYLVATLTDAPLNRVRRIFSYRDHTSAAYAIRNAQHLLATNDPVMWAVHDRAIAEIKSRWPEYADYAPAAPMCEAA